MGVPMATEQRVLSDAEFDVVKQTHYPAIMELSQSDLADVGRRLRAFCEEARDLVHGQRRQRRAMRGRASPRGVRPAVENVGISRKRQVFAGALKRVNRALGRIAKDPQGAR
ncbi:MAG TPA: hypothetical protein VFV80_12040 [Geminicoccaceae bacterium]|nr:hypothetical protein [Geminicoccaceae bacterium]